MQTLWNKQTWNTNRAWLTKPNSTAPQPPGQKPANRLKILHRSGFLAKRYFMFHIRNRGYPIHKPRPAVLAGRVCLTCPSDGDAMINDPGKHEVKNQALTAYHGEGIV